MCSPAQASLSAATIAGMLVVCSLVVPPHAHAQDASLPPVAGSASMELAPEVEVTLAGLEASIVHGEKSAA